MLGSVSCASRRMIFTKPDIAYLSSMLAAATKHHGLDGKKEIKVILFIIDCSLNG